MKKTGSLLLFLGLSKGLFGFDITTSIVIKGSPSEVWSEFSAFHTYQDWNPFITNVKGNVKVAEKIHVSIDGMNFKPKILTLKQDSSLSWRGRVLFPGLFDGTHSFELKDNHDGTTTFIQNEHFSGILVPFFKSKLNTNTRHGFNEMNKALKKRVEDKHSYD